MLKKVTSYLILALIIVYGILKFRVLTFYAPVAEFMVDLVGLDSENIIDYFNKVTKQETRNEDTLGWLIYYPTYFLLHVAFISVLYRENKKVRNILIIGLSALIGTIILGIFIFKFLEISEAYQAFVSTFRALFGLPFILLCIEGGRVLYRDVQQLSNKN